MNTLRHAASYYARQLGTVTEGNGCLVNRNSMRALIHDGLVDHVGDQYFLTAEGVRTLRAARLSLDTFEVNA